MARQEIILGTPPNGLGGDPPRVASQKINFMTQELYDKAAGLKSAAFADVVGYVASGAIIEQGTNASGSFIKFADGTLITWGIRIISYGAGGDLPAGRGQAWDGALQPATFVGQPAHNVTLSFTTGQDGTGIALYTLMQTYWMNSRVLYVGVNTGHAPAFVHPPMEYGTLAAGSFVASFQSSGRWK